MKTKNIVIWVLFVGTAFLCLTSGSPKSVNAVPPGCVTIDSSMSSNWKDPKLNEEDCSYSCTFDRINGDTKCPIGQEQLPN